MSLYLFLLCTEKLAILIQEKVDSGDWQLVKILGLGPLFLTSFLHVIASYLLRPQLSKLGWLMRC